MAIHGDHWQTGLFWLLPVFLLVFILMKQPFSYQQEVRRAPLSSLTAAQRMNLKVAAETLNGVVLRPGETFSFNRIVGPRTRLRGYAPATTYLQTESPDTLGGGICLLSSLVYQLALNEGFRIEERVPHLRTIHSVPPGLDATVWYGKADLKFINTQPYPVQIQTRLTPQHLEISLNGRPSEQVHSIHRRMTRLSPTQVQVEVFRKTGTTEQFVSRDLYRFST
jgi:vancomycin resistance protein VanW